MLTSNKRKILRLVFSLASMLSSSRSYSSVPRPDHVVVCVLENHAYQQVIGSSAAPYINHLASVGANMGEYYGLTHPSQPNYIMLFSGDNQGHTSNTIPAGTPFNTPNLGASLINAGFTFAGYSEDLPSIGSLTEASGAYARKHSPWTHWQGTGVNQIPASCNLTIDNFPADFNQLPDLSFVIPNLNNAMHDGTDPGRIEMGDDFVENYLSAYESWAMNHNSLLIVLFDEDDSNSSNHVPCIFVGPMVVPGNYSQTGYHHYDMLRTLEDMFGLPYAGNSSNAKPIEEIWRSSTGIVKFDTENKSAVYPNPVSNVSYITLENNTGYNGVATLQINDILGNVLSSENLPVKNETRSIPINRQELQKGIYFYRVMNSKNIISAGKFTVD